MEDLIARNRKPDEAIEQRVVIQLRGSFGKISKLSGSVSLCPALPCWILPRSAIAIVTAAEAPWQTRISTWNRMNGTVG